MRSATVSGVSLAQQFRFSSQSAGKIGGSIRTDRVERSPCLLQGVALVRKDRHALLTRLSNADGGTRKTFDGAPLICRADLVAQWSSKLAFRWAEVGEDRPRLLGHLADDLDNPLAEGGGVAQAGGGAVSGQNPQRSQRN